MTAPLIQPAVPNGQPPSLPPHVVILFDPAGNFNTQINGLVPWGPLVNALEVLKAHAVTAQIKEMNANAAKGPPGKRVVMPDGSPPPPTDPPVAAATPAE